MLTDENEIAHEHREFSEHTAQVIDEEVARILSAAADEANRKLAEHRTELDTLAEALQTHEVIDELEIEKLIGPSVNGRAESNGQPPGDASQTAATGSQQSTRESAPETTDRSTPDT